MAKKTKATGRVASDNTKKSITEFKIVRVSVAEFNKLSVDNPADYIGLSDYAKKIKKAINAEMAVMGVKPDYAAEILYMNDEIHLVWFMTDEVIH